MRIIEDPSDVPWVERYIYAHYGNADRVLTIDLKK
jgi:hypothetical protein